MSSTSRGGKRNESDVYPTPSWCVHRLLEHLPCPVSGLWLEPAAGDGAIIRAVEEVNPSKKRIWTAVELRKECLEPIVSARVSEIVIDNFFSVNHKSLGTVHGGRITGQPFDVIVTNPPFSLAEEFIRACLPLARTTIMLLRLNFFGSEGRADFLRSHAPDIYALPNRPGFGLNKHGKPGTDSIEYGWFVWSGEQPRRTGSISMLASTPKEIRNARKDRKASEKEVRQVDHEEEFSGYQRCTSPEEA